MCKYSSLLYIHLYLAVWLMASCFTFCLKLNTVGKISPPNPQAIEKVTKKYQCFFNWSFLISYWSFAFFSVSLRYREKAKKDVEAVGNYAAKLLQTLGKVSKWKVRCPSFFLTYYVMAQTELFVCSTSCHKVIAAGRWVLLVGSSALGIYCLSPHLEGKKVRG